MLSRTLHFLFSHKPLYYFTYEARLNRTNASIKKVLKSNEIHPEDRAMLKRAGYDTSKLFLRDPNKPTKIFKPPKQMSLDEFVYMLLWKYNHDYCTMNEDCLVECFPHSSRSLGDIFRIAATYYPRARLWQIRDILLNFKDELVGHFCSDIGRRVYELKKNRYSWSQMTCGAYEGEESITKDEFGVPIFYLTSKSQTKKS